MGLTPHLSKITSWRRSLGAATRSLLVTLVVSATALVGIANREAFMPVAYRDSVGVPTLGYGTTEGVKMGDKTTPERALVRLLKDAEKFGAALQQCIKVPLFQYEFDAFLSLAYNIGASAFCNSTLVKLLNQGDYQGACQQILRWDKAGGKTLAGLTTRRQAEYQQCLGKATP